jgi:hypothetical protein
MLNLSSRPNSSSSISATRLLQTSAILGLLALIVCIPGTGYGQAADQRYLDDVKHLTAPEMEGRGDGTKGLTLAARLIEQRYKGLGLEPAGAGSYFQSFSLITGSRMKGDNLLHVQNGAQNSALKLNQDFVPFSFSSSGTASGPVVFAGYGASASEFGYDDYQDLDVKDKIVVVLRYEPSGFAAKHGNTGLTQHSELITKAINARNHGAKAVVIVNGALGHGEEDVLTRFGSSNGPVNSGILLVQAKNEIVDSWFRAAGKSLADVQGQINAATRPSSFSFPESLRMTLKVDIETTRATVNNVLAYLPGQTDEYVVLGAHYDHLGRGNFDSLAPSQIGQIHPGADDNASGSHLLLHMAFQTKGLISLGQQFGIDRTVDRMTRGAALTNGLVFEDERAPLRRMALAAGVPFRRQRSSSAFHRRARMRVVAITATDFAFQDRMMVRQIEFATLVEVALETNLWRSFGIDDRVIGATGFVVNAARAMARLTAYIRRIGTLGLQQRVSCRLKTFGNVFMALLTSFSGRSQAIALHG